MAQKKKGALKRGAVPREERAGGLRGRALRRAAGGGVIRAGRHGGRWVAPTASTWLLLGVSVGLVKLFLTEKLTRLFRRSEGSPEISGRQWVITGFISQATPVTNQLCNQD